MWAPFKKLAQKQKGFTIIEVMIVLAIAGLIIAVVLLAVPALQRSQRNNARTADANHLNGIVSDYAGNHGGALPLPKANCTTAQSPDVALYNSSETFSQLQSCAIVDGQTGDANIKETTTNFVVDENTYCDHGVVKTPSANANAYTIVWQYEAGGGQTNMACVGSGS